MAKLTQADVDLIRELREAHRLSYSVLAEKFEVSKRTIKAICRYETWVSVVHHLAARRDS